MRITEKMKLQAKTMSLAQKQRKILSTIIARGWFPQELYIDAGNKLVDCGIIRGEIHRTSDGYPKFVWVWAE